MENNSALILSQTLYEATTDAVCKWLNHYGVNYKRINGEDLLKIIDLSDLPNDENIQCIWYRRKISKYYTSYELKKKDFISENKIQDFLNTEFNTLHSYLFYKYSIKKWINNPITDKNLNKLDVIFKAKDLGISIPHTEVVTTKSKIQELLNKKDNYIVKPISECIFINHLGKEYKMLTKMITKETLKHIPNTFFPSLIQENVEKKFEIRTFYLYGSFYSMAIFSQQNEKTKSDFRNYDSENPNRTVPYKLPLSIEKKLNKLMKFYEFNTGSIDLIYDMEGNYVFLEINPDGQFGMVSYPCNYYLEKKVALKIKDNVEKK